MYSSSNSQVNCNKVKIVSFIIQIIKQLDSAVIHITRHNYVCCGHWIPKLSTLATSLLPNFVTNFSLSSNTWSLWFLSSQTISDPSLLTSSYYRIPPHFQHNRLPWTTCISVSNSYWHTTCVLIEKSLLGLYSLWFALNVMLHETIRKDNFSCNTALERWNNVATIRNNVAAML